MYYILVNNNTFYVSQSNDHVIIAQFAYIDDAFRFINYLYSLNCCCGYCNECGQQNTIPVYDHVFFGDCYHCYCCERAVYQNCAPQTQITDFVDVMNFDNIMPEPIAEFSEEIIEEPKIEEVIVKEVIPAPVVVKPKIEKPKKPKKVKVKREPIKLKKAHWISIAILASLLIVGIISTVLYFVLTKVTENNLIRDNEIYLINRKTYSKKIKFNKKVEDLEIQKKDTPSNLNIDIDSQNKEITFTIEALILAGNYYVNFNSSKFEVEKKVSVKVIDEESIKLSPSKAELTLGPTAINNKKIKYNEKIIGLKIVEQEGTKVNVSIDEKNHEVILNPQELGESKIKFEAENSKTFEVLTINTTEQLFEIGLEEVVDLEIKKGIQGEKTISYNKYIRDLEISSSENEVVKIEIDSKNNKVKFTALKNGSVDVTFKSQNAIKDQTVKVNVNEIKEDFNISEDKIELEIIKGKMESKVISYNKEVVDLKITEKVGGIVKFDINSKDGQVNLTSIKEGQETLTLESINAKTKETILVTVTEQKEEIKLSKKSSTLNITNGKPSSDVVEYSKEIDNLSLRENEQDIVNVNIDEKNNTINLVAKNIGQTTLTFFSSYSSKDETVEVIVEEIIIKDPVIQQINDQKLFIENKPTEVELKIIGEIDGEKPVVSNLNDEAVEMVFDTKTNIIKLDPKKEGESEIKVSYTKAIDMTFKVIVNNKVNIKDFQSNLGYIDGFANKTSQSDLTQEDKDIILTRLFEVNGYDESSSKPLIDQLDIKNYLKDQKQTINRTFTVALKSNAVSVEGEIKGAIFKANPLDLSDPGQSQIRDDIGWIYIDGDVSPEQLNEAEFIEKEIVEQFIIANEELNPMLPQNLQVKKNSAINSASIYKITIQATPNQLNTQGEVEIKMQGFLLNGVANNTIDIEELFGAKESIEIPEDKEYTIYNRKFY
ncbi:hypothetical protein [Spiroplasma endosymbiont of Diplazon laetatorius]|uniref:hypothetical protein n=1 Tax=Spiroplasma endosymbiont of Diplazon laetatorius TaxID=3066322 RepID=UPI0030CCCA1D